MDMDMMLKPVEDQILAEDDRDSVTMDRVTADALVSIAESVLICEAFSGDTGELHTDLNKLNAVDKYKCEQASAYAATLMNYPHICRMQCERDDLLHNMAKLSNYYEDHFSELTEKQRDYMCKQLTAMRAYADILHERITYDIQYYSYNTK